MARRLSQQRKLTQLALSGSFALIRFQRASTRSNTQRSAIPTTSSHSSRQFLELDELLSLPQALFIVSRPHSLSPSLRCLSCPSRQLFVACSSSQIHFCFSQLQRPS
jgi:hypothetical protein